MSFDFPRVDVLTFRSFRNPDLPVIRQLWVDCRLGPGAASGVSNDALDHCLFSQLHFDPRGLIIACDEAQPVGYAHAGIVPKLSGWGCQSQTGVIAAVMVHPQWRRQGVGRQLIGAAEQYLESAGAQEVYAGEYYPCDLFYLGLYGSSRASGFLESDAAAAPFVEACGFRPASSWLILAKDLAGAREPFDPKVMSVRRKFQLVDAVLPPSPTRRWLTVEGRQDSICFLLSPQGGGQPVASITAWNMQFHSEGRGQRIIGLCDLQIAVEDRRRGYAKTLLLDVFRKLREEAYSHVEMSVPENQPAALSLLTKLGFLRSDRGVTYHKLLRTSAAC